MLGDNSTKHDSAEQHNALPYPVNSPMVPGGSTDDALHQVDGDAVQVVQGQNQGAQAQAVPLDGVGMMSAPSAQAQAIPMQGGATAMDGIAEAQAMPLGGDGEMAKTLEPAKMEVGQGSGMPQAALGTEKAEATIIPGSVMATLPPVIPEAQIVAQYQQQGINTTEYKNDAEYNAAPVAEALPPDGYFFTAGELQVLNAQPVPAAVDYATVANAPPPPAQYQESPPIALQPSGGAMPIMVGAYSSAKVKSDSMKSGIKSYDPILNNHIEILKFLNFHNTRPGMWLHVEGYHHRTKTTRDANGNTRTTTERVTDFQYNIPLTQFIYPYGKITVSSSSNETVEQMIDSFLADTNRLKSLQMKKRVYWDIYHLRQLVRMYIRRLGWHRELDVIDRYDYTSVRVCTESKAAKAWDNCCCRVMSVITIIPALVFCIYGSGHRERGLRSIFVIQYSALQVFDMIRPQIYVPGFATCSVS